MDNNSNYFNLILNSSNVVSNSNNTTFQYNFKGGAFAVKDGAQICVSSITMPYSFFNVNQTLYNNSTFTYRWYSNSSTYVTYTVTLPNGFYQASDINNYLQQYMISQNQYLINSSTGAYQYFISILTNTTYYSNQILTFQVPATLPSGYTAPSGFVFSGYVPTVQILNNNFGALLGFTAGSYPTNTQATSYSALSNTVPNATPVNSIIVTSNIVNNPVTIPSNVLDSFTFSNTSFGSNIVYEPKFSKFINLSKGHYINFILNLVDQNFNPIVANDPNILINLIIKEPK